MHKNDVKYNSITKRKEVITMEEKVKISMLSQLYGKLLTEKQFEFIDDYYNNDLSLSEIAENNHITRQAVRDILKKGENKLFEYEEKLSFMKRMLNQEETLKKVLSELTKIQKTSSDKKVEHILETVKNLSEVRKPCPVIDAVDVSADKRIVGISSTLAELKSVMHDIKALDTEEKSVKAMLSSIVEKAREKGIKFVQCDNCGTYIEVGV